MWDTSSYTVCILQYELVVYTNVLVLKYILIRHPSSKHPNSSAPMSGQEEATATGGAEAAAAAAADKGLTPDEIHYTNCFNAHRPTLARFAACRNKDELHLVRDGFYLGMSSELCPDEYEPVRRRVVLDPAVASAGEASAASSSSAVATDPFFATVASARKSPAFEGMTRALMARAFEVGSDLESLWMGLETGRLEWLAAASSAHEIKTRLRAMLVEGAGDGGVPSEGDVSDAKMVWMYSLALSLPSLGGCGRSGARPSGCPTRTAPWRATCRSCGIRGGRSGGRSIWEFSAPRRRAVPPSRRRGWHSEVVTR